MSEGRPDLAPRVKAIPFNTEADRRIPEHMVGEWRPDVPRTYFRASALDAARNHLRGDLTYERGGLFIGTIHSTPGNIRQVEITDYIPELESQGTTTRINVINARSEAIETAAYNADLGQGDVVGWIHSHPGMRPAPSSVDESAMGVFSIFHNTNSPEFFTMVYDPTTNTCGVFRYENGRVMNQGGFAVLGNAEAQTLAGSLGLTPYHSLHSEEKLDFDATLNTSQATQISPKIKITKEQLEERRRQDSAMWNRFKSFFKNLFSE